MIIPIWVRAAVACGLLAAIIGGLGALHHSIYKSGYDAAVVAAKAENQKAETAARNEFDAATATALTTERSLRKRIDDLSADRLKKENEYENAIATLQSRVRDGSIKLRIAVAKSAVPECASPTDTSTASGASAEALADVMPETAARILRIAGDAAKDVRDYNRVVDIYNNAREICNAPLTGASETRSP